MGQYVGIDLHRRNTTIVRMALPRVSRMGYSIGHRRTP